MKTKILKIALVAVALFIGGRALAWENIGHAVIAYNAERLLDPEVKAKCRHYLKASIPFYATWMDQARSIEPYTVCDKWHSTNIDAKYKVVVGSPTTGAYHIERIRKEMANGAYKTMPDSLVKINLQYLIHMVGDHHCPVHVRWNKEEHPQFHYNLQHNGKKLSSHGFWDGAIAFKRRDWRAEKHFEHMQKLSPKQAKKMQKGTAYDWTQETADVWRKHCFYAMPAGTDRAKMSSDDVATVHAIVDKQVQRAAYRLAGVLTEIFKE